MSTATWTWSTCGRSRAATTAPRPCRSRSGPGCGPRGRPPAGPPSRPARRCRPATAAGRAGRRRSAAGRAARRAAGRRARTGRVPCASRNSPGPKPKVIVRPPGGRPIASPVSSGGASGAPSVGPTGPAGRPCVIRSAARVHALQQGDELGPRARGDVERGEVQPVLRRRDDAGLVRAAEGVRRRPRPSRRRRR